MYTPVFCVGVRGPPDIHYCFSEDVRVGDHRTYAAGRSADVWGWTIGRTLTDSMPYSMNSIQTHATFWNNLWVIPGHIRQLFGPLCNNTGCMLGLGGHLLHFRELVVALPYNTLIPIQFSHTSLRPQASSRSFCECFRCYR
jgi:hypothetical protein